MNFIIKLMSGERFIINKSEYENIIKADKGVFIPRLGSFINKSFVSTIYPEQKADEIEDRKSLQRGVLHDGTPVKRHFGQWIVADSQSDEPVRLNTDYYPEVALDLVFTEKEYAEIKDLPTDEKLKLLTDKDKSRFERLNNKTELTKISL